MKILFTAFFWLVTTQVRPAEYDFVPGSGTWIIPAVIAANWPTRVTVRVDKYPSCHVVVYRDLGPGPCWQPRLHHRWQPWWPEAQKKKEKCQYIGDSELIAEYPVYCRPFFGNEKPR